MGFNSAFKGLNNSTGKEKVGNHETPKVCMTGGKDVTQQQFLRVGNCKATEVCL